MIPIQFWILMGSWFVYMVIIWVFFVHGKVEKH